MKNLIILFSLLFSLSSCTQNEENPANSNNSEVNLKGNSNLQATDFPVGTNYSESAIAIQGAYNQFIQNLRKNEMISIVAEIDHARNAKSVGEELNFTKIVFFGNPNLGTPLMQRNQLAGLDLPQKALFYQTEMKQNIAIYNSVEYLRSRHNLEGVATLNKISKALENLVSDATKSPVTPAAQQNVGFKEGIITKDTERSFLETYVALRNAISSNANLTIVAELNHEANAESVGLELRPTKIIIFGNPNLGTALMQSEQTAGLDLPQKMLVWEDEDGRVHISYNDPQFIAERHNLEGVEMEIEKISNALNNLANAAAGS